MVTTELAPPTDFDFLIGRWRIRHRRLARILDPECRDWWEFESTAIVHPLLGGWGNCDDTVGMFPNGAEFHGATLRLYDAERGVWRLWWMTPAASGALDDPVEGGFADGVGTFDGPISPDIEGICRFQWRVRDSDHAQWCQMFSYDDGATWSKPNWVMDFERLPSSDEKPLPVAPGARRVR